MRTRTMIAALALFAARAGVCVAADAHMGTWKLNEAKSPPVAGASRGVSVVYAPAGDSVKVTVDGVGSDGKPAHNEWTGKYDGKDYPVVGDPNTDTRSYKRVDDRTLELTGKQGGKVSVTGRIVVAPDGKSRTVTLTTTDASGTQVTSTTFYDKQ